MGNQHSLRLPVVREERCSGGCCLFVGGSAQWLVVVEALHSEEGRREEKRTEPCEVFEM